MTDKSTPTDPEIDALWRFEASKNWDSTLAMRTSFTRAALAKWGTPAPVEVEPYGRITTHSVTGQQFFYRWPESPYLDNASECVSVYTRDQVLAMGREPLSDKAVEHYRNAIASACEGWTMPDGLRKHLETALWSPPTALKETSHD